MVTHKYDRLRDESISSNCSNISYMELQIEEESLGKTEELTERTEKTPKGYWLAVSFGLISAVIFTINNGVIQMKKLNNSNTIFLRAIYQLLVSTLWALFSKEQMYFGANKIQALIVVQGIASSAVLGCAYQSLRYMPLGDAMTLLFSSPFFTGKCVL